MKSIQLVVLTATLFALSVAGFGQGYQVITVANGGTITGTVKWSGPMPHLASMTIFKDQQICDPDSAKTRDLEKATSQPSRVWRITIMRGGQQMSVVLSG